MNRLVTALNQHKKRSMPFLFIALLVAALLSPYMPQASALTASSFQAGNIISSAVFTNYNSMSASDIQTFLNSKVPTCDTYGAQSSGYSNGSGGYYTRAQYSSLHGDPTPFTCLRDYVENPTTLQNNYSSGPTATINGGESAAQIIANAAQQYRINPEVILVTLQKEQGLVTDDWPWYSEYKEAMGYGCPDTGSCSSTYYGFYNQVQNAAKQFRYYLDHPNAFNYWTGSNYVQYSPTSSCGGSTLNIQTTATAALYIYTPYQPDNSVLAATAATSASSPGSATGDSCATYGNRNFWWYFTKWFGSTQTTIPYAWNFYSKDVFVDSNRTEAYNLPQGNINLAPGAKAYIRINALNNGNQPWTNSVVHLGASNPEDRCSIFSDSSWLSCGRIQMVQSSVAPGDVGTFQFSITAPQQTGSYREYFNVVADGITWLNDPVFYVPINVTTARAPINTSNITLTAEQTLTANQYLMSPDTHDVLLYQGDGNLVLYRDSQAIWTSGTSGDGVGKVIMQGDGNLVIYNQNNNAVWSSATYNNAGAYFTLGSDGNGTVDSASNASLWTTGTGVTPSLTTYANDTFNGGSIVYPLQSIGTADGAHLAIFQTDGNFVLYSSGHAVWASNTDLRQAAFMVMQGDGNLVIYDQNYHSLWASNTSGNPGARLVMQGDGNLVIYNTNNKAIWATNTSGH